MDMEAVAEDFVRARLNAEALLDFPGTIPTTLNTAYAYQDRAIALWPDNVAGWKVGRIDGTGKFERGQRGEHCRLEHDCAPRRECGHYLHDDLVQGHSPRRDRGYHADGLAQDHRAVPPLVERELLQRIRCLRDHVQRCVHVQPARERWRRALLTRDQRGEPIGALGDDVVQPPESFDPIIDGRRPPAFGSVPGRSDGLVNICRRSLCDQTGRLLG